MERRPVLNFRYQGMFAPSHLASMPSRHPQGQGNSHLGSLPTLPAVSDVGGLGTEETKEVGSDKDPDSQLGIGASFFISPQ